VREPEGLEMPPPGKSSERPWSKHREPDIRNVEAEGSSPFTSTKGQVTGLKWIPGVDPDRAPLSATGPVVEVEGAGLRIRQNPCSLHPYATELNDGGSAIVDGTRSTA
jgi:hypothetical protein